LHKNGCKLIIERSESIKTAADQESNAPKA